MCRIQDVMMMLKVQVSYLHLAKAEWNTKNSSTRRLCCLFIEFSSSSRLINLYMGMYVLLTRNFVVTRFTTVAHTLINRYE